MIKVDLSQALKDHQFNLRELQDARQAKMEQVAMDVTCYLIQSFGIRFAVPIARALSQAPNGTKVSLVKAYTTYYQKLKNIYESLLSGSLPSLSPFGSKRSIFSVETPVNLRARDTHFLLSNLPVPFVEVPELPCEDIIPEPYVALEEPHAALKATLFHILSQKADPPEDTDELHRFTTRCDAMRGIRWIHLIREWADKTTQSEKASALLENHALAPLVAKIEFTPDYKLPDPLDLPLGCCFQEYVCERTINLMEGILRNRLPERARLNLHIQLRENEQLRMRVAFALCPPEKFAESDLSGDRIENPILRDMRIALNLLSGLPSNPEKILAWVFLRNRSIKDVGEFDRGSFSVDSTRMSNAVSHVNSLRSLYQTEVDSSLHRTSNSEIFETHAFFLLVNLLNGQRPLNLLLFLGFCSEVPQMQVKTRQILPLVKKHLDDQRYEAEKLLTQEICSHFEGFRISPSPLFFDLITTCPIEMEEVRHRLTALREGLPFDSRIPIEGEALFEALQACFKNTREDLAFAIDLLKTWKQYRFSINQELRLLAVIVKSKTTPEGETGVSERGCFATALKFMKRLELFFGRLLPTENAFQLLFFHPNMKMRKKVSKNLTLLAGIRSELDLVNQMIIPTATLNEISMKTGTLIFAAPTGLLPSYDEFKTRPHLNPPIQYEALKVTMMQLTSQLNFSLLGVIIGPGNSDIPPTPFFQSFFPLKVGEGGVISLPPMPCSYSSLEEAPFNLPQTFYYGQWQIVEGRSRFLGTLIYEGTGKTVSLEVPLDLPLTFLVREETAFFTMLSSLYLEICNEFYCGVRPYQDEPIERLDDLLEFYADAKQVWNEYEPKEGSKVDIAPAVFTFLKGMRMQTREAMRMLSMHHIPISSARSYLEMAAACTLYPNDRLPSSSLLAPNIPDKYHVGFCIDEAVDKPLELFEQAKTPITDFTDVGELLTTNEKDLIKLPLKMKVVPGEDGVLIGMRAGDVEMAVCYPKAKFAPHHIVWQLLMLKGRFYRLIALS